MDGIKKAEFCFRHKADGMVNLKCKKRCLHVGCVKRPSFGVDGSNKMQFRSGHKTGGMV